MLTCLGTNKEVLNMAGKYGITPETDMKVVRENVLAYVGIHYLAFHK